jgi:hypothetical protein
MSTPSSVTTNVTVPADSSSSVPWRPDPSADAGIAPSIGHLADVARSSSVDSHDVASDVTGFSDLLTEWVDAESSGDAESLSRLLHAEFRGDDPLGYVLTKQQWIDQRRTGALTYTRFSCELRNIAVNNATAIASGIQSQVASYRGASCSGEFRITVVAVMTGGAWSIVNLQLVDQTDPRRGRASESTRSALTARLVLKYYL